MTAREAHKEQWNKLKDQPLQEKLKYIFTYYWAAILAVIFVIIFAVSWISGILTRKEIALSGFLINGVTTQSYGGDLREEFMAQQQLDAEKYEIRIIADLSYSPNGDFQNNLSVAETIAAQAAAGEFDYLVADIESYPFFSAYYADLKTVLTPAQLEKWQDRLVYVEKEALDFLTSEDINEFEFPEFFLSDEGLKEPIALGIRLPASSCLLEDYAFPVGEVIFGVSFNTRNIENTLAFLEYVMN